eukprot:350499-Chlamydomonas_euryale.AAC.11
MDAWIEPLKDCCYVSPFSGLMDSVLGIPDVVKSVGTAATATATATASATIGSGDAYPNAVPGQTHHQYGFRPISVWVHGCSLKAEETIPSTARFAVAPFHVED